MHWATAARSGAASAPASACWTGAFAADSPGHELKEDFYVQELPVPTLGLHLPLVAPWGQLGDFSVGRLSRVNSLRTEGGEVKLAQTNVGARIGVSDAFAPHCSLDRDALHNALVQSERSREDGNFVRLHSPGTGLRVEHGM
jgi:hypothetical protein